MAYRITVYPKEETFERILEKSCKFSMKKETEQTENLQTYTEFPKATSALASEQA